MWHEFRPSVKFFQALFEFDEVIAEGVREAGCPCGGRLHRADYPRKPRGLLEAAAPAYCTRISFCCNREGCRARTLPPSVRFLGRKVYVAAIVLVACAAYCHLRMKEEALLAAARAARVFDVPSRTLRRWSVYWTEVLPSLPGWQAERGRLMPPIDETCLPASLLERFVGGPSEKLLGALQFVAPMTTSPPRARMPMSG
jgi:hypothetical protein